MGSVSFSITWSVSARALICSLFSSHLLWFLEYTCTVFFSCLRFWFRLYWFPLKVLYATCVSSIRSVPTIPFYFFFNALLFSLLLMNIYWFLVRAAQVVSPASVWPTFCDVTSSLFALFPPCRVQFIVIFVVKVLKVKEVNDVREYEEEEDSKAAAGLLGESGAAHKDDGAGHHHIAAQGWAPPPPPSLTSSFLMWQLSFEAPRSSNNPKITYQWLQVQSWARSSWPCYHNYQSTFTTRQSYFNWGFGSGRWQKALDRTLVWKEYIFHRTSAKASCTAVLFYNRNR